jgi:hypothetical protein
MTVLTLFGAAFFSHSCKADEATKASDWTGQTIIAKKPLKFVAARDASDMVKVHYGLRELYPIHVHEDRAGWLRISDANGEVWVNKNDFILSQDAPAYFTERIKDNPTDVRAWRLRAMSRIDLREYDEAVSPRRFVSDQGIPRY